MFNWFDGKKTKLLAAATMAAGAYAIMVGGDPEATQAVVQDGAKMFGEATTGIQTIWAGAMAWFIRSGIDKMDK